MKQHAVKTKPPASPLYQDPVFKEAFTLHQAGKYAEAVPLYRRMIEKYPDDDAPLLNLGSALRKLAHFDAALACCQRALGIKPGNPSALTNMGNILVDLDRMDEALRVDPRLQPSGAEAASLRSQLLDSYHERAVVLYRDQQLDKAIALWNRVLAIAPDYEPAIAYRARALELKQRLKQY